MMFELVAIVAILEALLLGWKLQFLFGLSEKVVGAIIVLTLAFSITPVILISIWLQKKIDKIAQEDDDD